MCLMKDAILILLTAIITALVFEYHAQPRFQQTPSRYMMFDNKTAQDCYAGPHLGGIQMPDGLSGGLPYCSDLIENPKVEKFDSR
jgi:hypothetical protein